MEIREILRDNNFKFNKALGQNFITDNNLLEAIVNDADITNEDVVVEIGAGAGTLTRALCAKAKFVYAFEVDGNLENILNTVLKGLDNVKIIFADVLKMSDEDFESLVPTPFKVVANLPYYITTPLIMRFLESELQVRELTLMMQKEVADRLVSPPGKPEYGAITAAVDAAGNAVATRTISRNMFYPMPKVDSALLRIVIDKNKYKIDNVKLFKKVVKSAFLWRRKTFANNLQSMFSLPKTDCDKIIEKAGFSPMVRGEVLGVPDFLRVCSLLSEYGVK